MINLLTADVTCSSVGLANILSIIKTCLNIIQIAGPIIGMVALVINFTKLMANPEEKKYSTSLKNSLIAMVMLFFLPFIINLTMGLLDNTFNLANCWTNAEKVKAEINNSNYIPTSDKERKSIWNYQGSDGGSSSSTGSSNSKTTTQNTSNKNIFIGDSRTEGMKTAVNTGDVWSCKTSKGLDWMKSTGVPNVENKITKGSRIVILMGVNDLYRPNTYISYINSKAKEWTKKGAKVYFVSVNPTNGNYDNLNSQINTFNIKLKKGLSSNVKYIDCNSYLKSAGFKTTDGLHYTSDTYKKIYQYITNNL